MGAILEPEHRWECPACDLQEITHEAKPHTRMHQCAGALGMTVPMIPAGTRAKLELVERQDYVGRDLVDTAEDGKVYMSAVVTRDEGTDVAVYPGTATAQLSDIT